MSAAARNRTLRCRAVWISDIHLGFRGCQADQLLDFLRNLECETLYLVGDILDLWSLQRTGFYWPQSHNNVVRTLLGKAKHGTRVIWIPGNHDELLRDYAGLEFGNVLIQREARHETADGKQLWITHGDEFDGVVRCSRWLAKLGSVAYDWLLDANRWLNAARRRLGFPYWSLAAYLKHRVKEAVNFITEFETVLAREARKRGADGVVCGHIHRAELREIDSILYCNDGDWVESCTALIERPDGSLELLEWVEPGAIAVPAPLAPAPRRAA